MGAFIDGDDLCAGCSRCCEQIAGLTVTPEELARVPKLREHVARFDGTFYVIDVKGGRCPYLSDEGWCTTFDTRPFDCSLYPVALTEITQRDDGSALVKWHKGALECPQPDRLMEQVQPAHFVALEEWVGQALGVARVELERRPDAIRQGRLRIAAQRLSRRLPIVRSLVLRRIERRRRPLVVPIARG